MECEEKVNSFGGKLRLIGKKNDREGKNYEISKDRSERDAENKREVRSDGKSSER